MKKLSSKITAVLFASCISLNALASTITVNWDGTGDTSGFGGPEDWALSVVIQPETPTIYDSIEIISTGVRGSGPVTVENTFFQIDEAALTLDIFLNVGFLTVVSPWHYTENIGTLPAGVYDLTVTAYADYGPPETCFTSLNVVVPKPTITVNWDGTGDFLTIQDGIDAAVDGDVVAVADGLYMGLGNRDIDYKGKSITVSSINGQDNCVIDCEKLGRAFLFKSYEGQNAILEGFTIQNGHAREGGGIYCENSAPTIRYCVIRDCIADGSSISRGGGIYCRQL